MAITGCICLLNISAQQSSHVLPRNLSDCNAAENTMMMNGVVCVEYHW